MNVGVDVIARVRLLRTQNLGRRNELSQVRAGLSITAGDARYGRFIDATIAGGRRGGAGIGGVGPMMGPLTVRLKPEEQAQVDSVWENMLTPVDRVERDVLLDVVCEGWMFQVGVDRLRLVSEKAYAHGRVVMEIDCDRANPEADQFSLTVLDKRGRTVRRERYGGEIEERIELMRTSLSRAERWRGSGGGPAPGGGLASARPMQAATRRRR